VPLRFFPYDAGVKHGGAMKITVLFETLTSHCLIIGLNGEDHIPALHSQDNSFPDGILRR